MEFVSRRDQFAYFVGFVARTQNNKLNEALDEILKMGLKRPFPEDVFDYCPFNDGQAQIIRGYHIFENSRSTDLKHNLLRLLGEYIFLVSDFLPPCCGDGRTFYCQASDGEIVLECDRCGIIYSLDESVIEKTSHMRMCKNDFIKLISEASASDWPFHLKLQLLLSDADGFSKPLKK